MQAKRKYFPLFTFPTGSVKCADHSTLQTKVMRLILANFELEIN